MKFPLDCAIVLVIERIVAHSSPDMIYFFGSRARGDHEPDSDLDLLIVIPDPVVDRRQLQNELRQVLVGHRPIVEPWIMGRLEFEETKDVVGGLAYPATHDGYVIYAKS
jgi:predicted nucleotidyltransferase